MSLKISKTKITDKIFITNVRWSSGLTRWAHNPKTKVQILFLL